MAEVDQMWLDYTINNNTNGVLKVLAEYGYIGFLAPQSMEDVREYCYDIIHEYGDDGVVSLLKAHPEYEAFKELFSDPQFHSKQNYRNAVSGITGKVDSFVSKLRPIDQAFVALGVFVAVYYVTKELGG
jgi:hypothetical protein